MCVAVTNRAQDHCSSFTLWMANADRLLRRIRPRSSSICVPPLPIRYRPKTMSVAVIRIVDHEVKRLSRVLQSPIVIYDFNQKGDIPIGHVPAKIIPSHPHTERPRRIRRADISPLRVRRPLALSRREWDLVNETEFAFEEEVCQTGSWGRQSVVVSEAHGVRIIVGGCEIAGGFLTGLGG